MGIRDKLSRLDTTHRSADPPAPAVLDSDWIQEIQHELQLKVLQEDKSYIFLKENTWPLYQEPFYEANRDSGFAIGALQKLMAELPPAVNGDDLTLTNILFIDTETTGLSGGTGTYPFLIGIGHVELDHVVVRQYLLPEFNHEWLMLKHLDQHLSAFPFTLSFNGKSFDLPLLRTRYLLNRMESGVDDCLHLDLLHIARRIWRKRLPACDLQTLEREILGKDRIGDIPGDIIPQIYFEFIRKRDAWMLRDVLEHNFYDVVNMVLLTLHVTAACESPGVFLTHSQDQLSFAMYLIKKREFGEAIALLEQLRDRQGEDRNDTDSSVIFFLSLCYKKTGKSEKSKLCLQALIDRQVLHPNVIEALAKFYEHEDKDYAGAFEIVERGIQYLQMIQQLNDRSPLLKFLPQMKHRYQRLHRKMNLK